MRPDATPTLRLRLFGPFEVSVGGQPLPRLRFRKSQALLALLALRHGAVVEREWLRGLLWPEEHGTQSLRNCLTGLRQALGPEAGRLVSPTSRTLALELTGAEVDVLAFDAALARGDPAALAEAVALYRGPLLEGWNEEWLFQERQGREQGYLAARERLAALAVERGDPAGAERHLRAAIAADPLRESAQRGLMAALAAGGNYAAALLCYRELRERLHRELNAEPDPETRALFQRLREEARAQTSAGGPARTAATPPAPAPQVGAGHREAAAVPAMEPLVLPGTGGDTAIPHNLPLQLTSFIGRQDEVAGIQELLSAQRLITLTGAGGCGKTRLALEAAAGLLPAYPDGVWLVSFGALADPALVPEGVAAALGIKEQPERPVAPSLVEVLKPKQLLLLLDNCEHLVHACAALAETLLQACPHLSILATSREPLGSQGERPYRVPSLSLPPAASARATGTPPLNTLLQYEAIRLFVERAVTAQPAFAVTAENSATVARICLRLDGIPLAVELAAARLKALPLETLHDRLNNMFDLLTGGRRTALPRHQTLRATLDWSYNLLTPAEQTLLRGLSVFAGGFTLEAAEAVCGPDQVLDLLTRLVDKSLLVYEERYGEGRYRLLEMIREYARERLEGSGETAVPRGRHLRWCLALAETGARELTNADPGRWLDRLEREHDNLRAALAWSLETGQAELGLRLGSALQEFWISRGHVTEGRARLHALLAHPGTAAPGPTLRVGAPVRARGLGTAGTLSLFRGELETARTLFEEGLAIWRRLEDRAGVADLLSRLGRLAADRWDWAAARVLVEESVGLWRELNNPAGTANALSLLAEVRRQEGDPAAARALIEENLAIWRTLGDRPRLMAELDTLAMTAMQQGDLDAARRAIEESLAVARELGHKPGIAGALGALGHVAHWRADWPEARAFFQESLALWRELDHKHGVVDTLGHISLTYMGQDEPVAAYRVMEEMLPLAQSLAPLYVARALASLGGAAADLGRWGEAAARCSDSLRLSRAAEYDDPIHVAWNLTVLARVALARGEPAVAARRLGSAAPLWARTTHRHHPFVHRELDRAESAVRGQMEPAAFEVARAAGQALSLEQAIAEALEETPRAG